MMMKYHRSRRYRVRATVDKDANTTIQPDLDPLSGDSCFSSWQNAAAATEEGLFVTRFMPDLIASQRHSYMHYIHTNLYSAKNRENESEALLISGGARRWC